MKHKIGGPFGYTPQPIKNHPHSYGLWEKAAQFDSTLYRFCLSRKCGKKLVFFQKPGAIVTAEEKNQELKSSKPFIAQFKGGCSACGKTIWPGDVAQYIFGNLHHQGCGTKQP